MSFIITVSVDTSGVRQFMARCTREIAFLKHRLTRRQKPQPRRAAGGDA
jgi:hypothetical protein